MKEGDAKDYAKEHVPVCTECDLRLEKVGENLTTRKSIPLYQCKRCRGDIYGIVPDPKDMGRVIGRVINGHWFKLGPDDEMIPVDHPDDVWG